MTPATKLDLSVEQLRARKRIAQMKRQAALHKLNKARWAFDRTPNEVTLAALRQWTITVMQLEHEMCGMCISVDNVEGGS